jgi:hypothetical protein
VTGRRGRRKELLDDSQEKERILEIERGSTVLHCVENWLWSCLKTHCGISDGVLLLVPEDST